MSSGKLECDDAAIKSSLERGMLNGLLRMEGTLVFRSRRVVFGAALQTEQMRADIL